MDKVEKVKAAIRDAVGCHTATGRPGVGCMTMDVPELCSCWVAAQAALAAMGEREAVAHRYPVNLAWSEEDSAWIATSPDLPGCTAVGDTQPQALREMQDAMLSWIDATKAAGNSIPKATLAKAAEWVPASPRPEAVEEAVKAET